MSARLLSVCDKSSNLSHKGDSTTTNNSVEDTELNVTDIPYVVTGLEIKKIKR